MQTFYNTNTKVYSQNAKGHGKDTRHNHDDGTKHERYDSDQDRHNGNNGGNAKDNERHPEQYKTNTTNYESYQRFYTTQE